MIDSAVVLGVCAVLRVAFRAVQKLLPVGIAILEVAPWSQLRDLLCVSSINTTLALVLG
eukprot:SAG11_NODE_339_length_10506_cov_12.368588_1_plen_59_part_00